MTLPLRVFKAAPISTIVGVSFFYLALLAPMLPDVLRLPFFYLFGLPSYLAFLISSALCFAAGVSPSLAAGLGLCIAVDILVVRPLRNRVS